MLVLPRTVGQRITIGDTMQVIVTFTHIEIVRLRISQFPESCTFSFQPSPESKRRPGTPWKNGRRKFCLGLYEAVIIELADSFEPIKIYNCGPTALHYGYHDIGIEAPVRIPVKRTPPPPEHPSLLSKSKKE
jgi:sRNA-binding carbon storage regulator CsrA